MKTSYLLLSFVALMSLGTSSCGDHYIHRGNAHLICFPRACEQIVSLPMRSSAHTYTFGKDAYTSRRLFIVRDEGVQAEDFVLWVMTGAPWIRERVKGIPSEEARDRWYETIGPNKPGLAPRNRELERQLAHDYNNRPEAQKQVYRASGDYSSLAPPTPWAYRVTGVKDFRIVSLSPLFGQPAESSLNDYFSIYEFSPRQIISSRTKTLLWGYSDKRMVTNIGQWLSMEPMAPPVVMFRLKRRPEELPIKTKLVSILETTEGKVLRDTLEVELR